MEPPTMTPPEPGGPPEAGAPAGGGGRPGAGVQPRERAPDGVAAPAPRPGVLVGVVGMVAVVVAAIFLVAVVPGLPGGGTPWEERAGGGAGAAVGSGCGGHQTSATRQLRGMWLTTVGNADWPSRPGLDPETAKAEYRGWLDLARQRNLNAIFVQVRPSGDAFWPSKYAPWSEWLTGRRDGKDPGWDPMAFMVSETHRYNIEFHAWFNPYRGSSGGGADPGQLAPEHPLRQHPEWMVAYPAGGGGKLYFDPGNPDARRYVEDSILDAVARYDLDGVHFDDFFYPYPDDGEPFGDDASFAKYRGDFTDRGDWRRDNVNRLVQETGQRIKARKPWVKFGISPFGIWRNAATDPLGSATRGLQGYDAIYADVRLWVKRQWLDYVVPQLYWQIGFEIADYAKLVPWWSDLVAGTRVQLYIGQADYRIGNAGAWSDPGELDRQLALNRRYPVSGSVHFTARDIRADRLGAVSRYHAAHDAAPALVPLMPHLPVAHPAPPTITGVHRDAATGAVTVTWKAAGGTAAKRFAVYRVPAAASPTGPAAGPSPAAGPEPAVLVATAASAAGSRAIDRTAVAGQEYEYCVTAIDRLWNESRPSTPRRVA